MSSLTISPYISGPDFALKMLARNEGCLKRREMRASAFKWAPALFSGAVIGALHPPGLRGGAGSGEGYKETDGQDGKKNSGRSHGWFEPRTRVWRH